MRVVEWRSGEGVIVLEAEDCAPCMCFVVIDQCQGPREQSIPL